MRETVATASSPVSRTLLCSKSVLVQNRRDLASSASAVAGSEAVAAGTLLALGAGGGGSENQGLEAKGSGPGTQSPLGPRGGYGRREDAW